MNRRPFFVIPFLIILASAALITCAQPPAADDEAVRKAGIAAAESLKDAVVALDVEKIISKALNSPEFRIYSDGKAYTYDEFVKVEREDFPKFQSVQMRLDTLIASVLGPDAVAVYGSFHQVLTFKEGGEGAFKGDATWIFVRRGTDWKLLYSHGRHSPDVPAN